MTTTCSRCCWRLTTGEEGEEGEDITTESGESRVDLVTEPEEIDCQLLLCDITGADLRLDMKWISVLARFVPVLKMDFSCISICHRYKFDFPSV